MIIPRLKGIRIIATVVTALITLSAFLVGSFEVSSTQSGNFHDPNPYNPNPANSENLIGYVNPFIGNDIGNTYPSARVPFGMTKWAPLSARDTMETGAQELAMMVMPQGTGRLARP